MYYHGAVEPELCVNILNCLDDATLATIMLSIGPQGGNYYQIKEVLISNYGSPEQLEDDKANFLAVTIGKDESLRDFGRRFVTDARSLTAMCHITPRELATALLHAISPFPHLKVFQPLLFGPVTEAQVFRVAETLSTHRMNQQFKSSFPRKIYHAEEYSEDENVLFSKVEKDSICHTCGQKGHWSRRCPKKVPYKPRESAVHLVEVDTDEEEVSKKD